MVRPADVYRAILTGQPYRVRALAAFGSDPLLAHANPLLGRQALQELGFYVHADLFANPSASQADMLLPAASCWETEAVLPARRHTVSRSTPVPERSSGRPSSRPCTRRGRPGDHLRPGSAAGPGRPFFGEDIESAFDYQLAPPG
jgi:anaerobic selenocysteine-containing dehydrogenase